MTAIISPAAAREIVDWVRRSDGTDASLRRIATDHGLTLTELRTLLGKGATPLVQRPPIPAGEKPDRVEGTKTCTKCRKAQPLSEFHAHPDTRDGKSSQCRTCNSKRKPTVSRIIRTRARGRAMYRLIETHRSEFEALLEEETLKAEREHQEVVAAAEARGQADAHVARLKSGPKRKDQTSAIERLDVARCPLCQGFHDAGHQCTNCGHDHTPSRLEDLRLMAESRENANGAAARLGLTYKGLEKWCARHGASDLWQALVARNPRDHNVHTSNQYAARRGTAS